MARHQLQRLHEKLKLEQSFITSEKDTIKRLNRQITEKSDRLCQQAWITKEHWLNVERILSVGSELTPSQCYHLTNLLDTSQFIDAYKTLGVEESRYGDFLNRLRQDSRLCARILAACDRLRYDTNYLATLFFHGLFADCVYVEDEWIALRTLKYLIDYQILSSNHLENYFQGGNHAFTILFKQYVAGVNTANIYLKAALQRPIRQLLIEDDTYIEYEPDKVLYRMSKQEKINLFGEPGTAKAEASMSNYLDNCRKRLVLICKTFLYNLKENMYCFPRMIKWLMSHLYQSLQSNCQLNQDQVKSILVDFLLNFYVCPAIVNPEHFGILGDVSVSDVARFNMSQVAKVMQFLSFADCGKKTPFHDNIYNYFEVGCVSSLLDDIIDSKYATSDPPNQLGCNSLNRSALLLSEQQIHAFVTFLKLIAIMDSSIVESSSLDMMLAKLPNLPYRSTSVDGSMTSLTSQISTLSTSTGSLKSQDNPGFSPHTVAELERYLSDSKIIKPENVKVSIISLGVLSDREPGSLSEKQVLARSEQGAPEANIATSNSNIDQPDHANCDGRDEGHGLSDSTALVDDYGPYQKLMNKIGALSAQCLDGNYQAPEQISPSLMPVNAEHRDAHRVAVDDKIMQHDRDKSLHQVAPSSLPVTPSLSSINSSNSIDTLLDSSHPTSHQLAPSSIAQDPDPIKVSNMDFSAVDGNLRAGDIQASDQEIVSSVLLNEEKSANSNALTSSNSNQKSNYQDPNEFIASFDPMHISTNYDSLHTDVMQDLLSLCNTNITSLPSDPVMNNNEFTMANAVGLNEASSFAALNNATQECPTSTKESQVKGTANTNSTQVDSLLDLFTDGVNQDAVDHVVQLTNQQNLQFLDSNNDSNNGSKSNINTTSMANASEIDAAELSTMDRNVRTGEIENFGMDNRSRDGSTVSSSSSGSGEHGNRNSADRKTKNWFKRVQAKGHDNFNRLFGMHKSHTIAFDAPTKKYEPDLKSITTIKEAYVSADDILKKYQRDVPQEEEPRKIPVNPARRPHAASFNTLLQSLSTPISVYWQSSRRSKAIEGVYDENSPMFHDAKRKMRFTLSSIHSIDLPFEMDDNTSLGDLIINFLQVQLFEAINLQDFIVVSQLHETLRCVKKLKANSQNLLVEALEKDYLGREPYVTYLVRCRQSLLSTLAFLDKQLQRIDSFKDNCKYYFTSLCVRLFLEQCQEDVKVFVNSFKKTIATDEKCQILEQFLCQMYEKIELHPIWKTANEEQLEDAYNAAERSIMSQIYIEAFYPNGEQDIYRDETLHRHIEYLNSFITEDHVSLQIPKQYQTLAPWPAAQEELAALNAYKTPQDKLRCIQRCCSIIMDLFKLVADQFVAAADDLVPILVFVLIKANPPSLLSNIEYINTFYETRRSGEEQYCWTHFSAAVAFVKTL